LLLTIKINHGQLARMDSIQGECAKQITQEGFAGTSGGFMGADNHSFLMKVNGFICIKPYEQQGDSRK